MTDQNSQVEKALRMIDIAEANLKNAKQILEKLAPDRVKHGDESAFTAKEEGDTQIVEGIFDGQSMVGPNGKNYPVPANYASKSKLLEGDKLKLTVMPNGTFLYKQIEPVGRQNIKGTLIKEDGQFKVLTPNKTYKVLLASVTYYKGNVGDEVSILASTDENSTWATIEALIPHLGGQNYSEVDSF
ncbi:hypothetical protein HY463_01320 [Candidatus Peregrinibacteria bacterium]|nr:hypothetical protein [Candidatus Peregrinibacteria bacterium]